MKKIVSIAGSIALLAASSLPAFAANNCENNTTGPESTNYCYVTNTSSVRVNNVSDAQIVNEVKTTSNTGGNSASYNTLGGAVSTGDASTVASVQNVANVNTTTISGGPAGSSNYGVNDITGPLSDNRVEITNSQRVVVDNSNTASVLNQIDASSNTGRNVADYNTGPASVSTGDAGLGVTLNNHVNDSATAISAGAGGTGGNTVANSTTGPGSINYVDIVNSAFARVNNVNDLLVENVVDARANSGDNSASYNTLGGDVLTGGASAGVGVETQGNILTTTIEMAMGGFANNSGNGVTGPLSDNRSDLVNSQNITVENWNNKCQSHNADRLGGRQGCDPSDLGVFNHDDDSVNTGQNASDYNTGGGASETGVAELVKTIMTHLNDTLTVIQ